MSNRESLTTTHTVLLIVAILFLGVWLKFLYTSVVTDSLGYKYTVRLGASIRSVTNDLHSQHIIKHPLLFLLLAHFKGGSHNLKAGEYFFPEGSTPLKIIDQITGGTGLVYYPFIIVPGWNLKQLRDALMQEQKLHHTMQNLSDAELMAHLGHSALNPEGEFFPDTYYFTGDSTDVEILKRAFKAMQKKLADAWAGRDKSIPFQNSYEALIAASIVEKEAYLEQERPIIAGVMINRLQKGMLLQFDPTVIYGLGARFDGKIYKQDLLKNTPYNTYIHKGLPPTPISMPSEQSILAVMHPQHNEYYYFVAKGDGAHQFSKTLTQHYAAVAAARKIDSWFFNAELVKHYMLRRAIFLN